MIIDDQLHVYFQVLKDRKYFPNELVSENEPNFKLRKIALEKKKKKKEEEGRRMREGEKN